MTIGFDGGLTCAMGVSDLDRSIAEPDALIGFAGPRVIKETIKRDLPVGFQRSEFLLEHAMSVQEFQIKMEKDKTKI